MLKLVLVGIDCVGIDVKDDVLCVGAVELLATKATTTAATITITITTTAILRWIARLLNINLHLKNHGEFSFWRFIYLSIDFLTRNTY